MKPTDKIFNSSNILGIISVLAMLIVTLASLKYNTKISLEKEKIEVEASYFNQEQIDK